jgi:superfamily I DNA/RNA helicase
MAKFSTKGRTVQPPPAPPPAPVEAAGTRWSAEQRAIFTHCEATEDNLIVRARAGTGKTTTILEALKHLNGSTVLCAFNKRIAKELESKVDGAAHVYTLHGLGYRFVRKGWPGVTVDEKRGMRLAEKALRMVGKPPTRDWLTAVCKLADIAKETLATVPEGLPLATQMFGCDDTLPNNYDKPAYFAAVVETIRLSCEQDGTVGFSDMLYVPLHLDLIQPCYDNVIVDEAQDMNAAQLAIAQRVCRKHGRIIVVGDDRQAIYGFRGADSGSIDRLKRALDAPELGLTTTYRCPKSIVALAAGIVKDYLAADSAPEGTVRSIPLSKLAVEAAPGDFILSRTNAPLLTAVLELTRLGKPAKIEGRDIGKGLQGIIYRMKARDVEEMLQLLAEWEHSAIVRAGGNESRIQQVSDQAAIIQCIAEDAQIRSVDDVLRKIESLFVDDAQSQAVVVGSTVHKAKGLEADRVFILQDTFKLGASGEEANINYVAITRAKKELVWVVSKGNH